MLDIGHCKLAAVLAAGTCLAGGARALTIETDSETGVTTLNASADEHVALTAEHVAQFGAGGLVKTGAGTVQAGDEMAGYTGPITVREGYYDVLTRGALGTADGDTFVDGGTLINHVASDTNGKSPSFANEHIHLKGTGWADNGALQNKVTAADFCRKVTLEGDTRVTGTLRCDFRYTAFDMKGFDLTTSFSSGCFYLVALTVANAGNLTAEGGAFEFQANVDGTSAAKTALFKSGSTLSFFNSSSWLNYRFVMEDNTTLLTGNDAFKLEGTDNRGIINGVLELRGTLKSDISKNHQTQWRGYVTGPGGFTGGKGGWVQINGPTNDFRGGLDLTGVAENGRATGGVVVWDDGAVPADGAPLKLRNAELWNWSDRPVTLPDFVVDGVGTVTGKTLTAATSVKSLAKTGAGDLRVALPLKVKGAADVQSGSLTLGTRVPENLGGLNYYYRPGNRGALNETAVPGGLPLSGVTSGADYAYKAWPDGVDQAHYYTGYIRVPGEEGADVRCNFMTSMARSCRVIIGGVTCARFNDNYNDLDRIPVGYARLAMYNPVTLKAGWQPIFIYMGNWYNDTRGPQPNTDLGWVSNFGIGVDWQARCVTNSAYYAKLVDPGDASFLRASLQTKDSLDPAPYRLTFEGPAAFGSGTTLDIDDTLPYTPFVVPALAGVPTVRRGAVKVNSSVWTLREGDLAGGVPLTIGSDASLTFPAGDVTVTATGDDLAFLADTTRSVSYPILTVEEGAAFPANAFRPSDALKAARWRVKREANTLYLDHTLGLTVIVR